MPRRNATAGRAEVLEALVGGRTPSDAATGAGVDLATVREWIAKDAEFRAELNARRQDSFEAGADRLRALVPVALDVFERELDGPRGLQAAAAILKATGLGSLEAPKGETDPEEIERSDRQSEVLKNLMTF